MSAFVVKCKKTGCYAKGWGLVHSEGLDKSGGIVALDYEGMEWSINLKGAKRFPLRMQAEGFIDVYGLTDCKVVALKGPKRAFLETTWVKDK